VEPEKDNMQTKWVEEYVSCIGASMIASFELAQRADELLAQSESMLINMQRGLEKLRMSIKKDVL